ncbi:hypothetical protein GDO78_018666 [Eleutherodactylus coqui]|uniref:GIY-YIG domain-containing protein n=1 Tax=Eleutherodactylus coqui TaxID=57060 RepID=A0A8J6B6Y0_ELECQ|nr:hypothetical protein GDO78_018666 [Eleutherodactylus coqui]
MPSQIPENTQAKGLPIYSSTPNTGAYRCGTPGCECRENICHRRQSVDMGTDSISFQIKQYLNCGSEHLIYLIECPCQKRYVGRTINTLRNRINQHRYNTKRNYLKHTVSKHFSMYHKSDRSLMKITPIKKNS